MNSTEADEITEQKHVGFEVLTIGPFPGILGLVVL
jgi:hypothetical protein